MSKPSEQEALEATIMELMGRAQFAVAYGRTGLARQAQDEVETPLKIYHRYAGAVAAFYESGGVDLTGRVPAKLERFGQLVLNSDAASAGAQLCGFPARVTGLDVHWVSPPISVPSLVTRRSPRIRQARRGSPVSPRPRQDLVCFLACFLLSEDLQPRALARREVQRPSPRVPKPLSWVLTRARQGKRP